MYLSRPVYFNLELEFASPGMKMWDKNDVIGNYTACLHLQVKNDVIGYCTYTLTTAVVHLETQLQI